MKHISEFLPTDKNMDRYNELYQIAIARFLDKSDTDVTEYLTEDESVEYKKLGILLNGECPFCGEDRGDCGCFVK